MCEVEFQAFKECVQVCRLLSRIGMNGMGRKADALLQKAFGRKW